MGADHTPLLTADGFDLLSLVRPNILALQPYRCARDDYDSGILLDANENAYGTAHDASVTDGFITELERYPDPMNRDLKAMIAAVRGVDVDNIFLGVGSDEAVDMCMRTFLPPGHGSILLNPPTYGMYPVFANANEARIVSVPLTEDFQLQPALIKETADKNDCRMIFIVTPNNPTGNDVRAEDIYEVIRSNPRRIVIVDEAYVDFSNQPSFASEVKKYPNLLVLQTMSKSFGLAGIRLGMAFGPAPLIEVFNRLKMPYSVSKPTVALAKLAWQPEGLQRMRDKVRMLNEQRERLIAGLKAMPEVKQIYPSNANFVLVRIPNAYEVYRRMAALGVVGRYRGNEPGCNDCIRVTVGRAEDVDMYLKVLRQVLDEQKSA